MNSDVTVGSKTLNCSQLYMNDNVLVESVGIAGDKPTYSTITRNYTGSTLTNGYTASEGVSVSGTASAINGGVYTATYTPLTGYEWSDCTTDAVSITMTIQYVWNKYNLSYSYTLSTASVTNKVVPYSSSNGIFYGTIYEATNTGHYYYYYDVYGGGNTSASIYVNRDLKSSYPYVRAYDINSVYPPDNHMYYVTSCYASGSSLVVTGTEYTVNTVFSAGTYIGQVTSTNINAYPHNGCEVSSRVLFDGYWYTKTW